MGSYKLAKINFCLLSYKAKSLLPTYTHTSCFEKYFNLITSSLGKHLPWN